MADEEMLDEVTVAGPGKKRKLRDVKMSPAQAGLLATVASSQTGPLAPLIGLGTYFYQKRRQSQFLDAQAQYLEGLQNTHTDLQGYLAEEMKTADPDEQRKLKLAQLLESNAFQRAAAGDPAAGELFKQAIALTNEVTSGDIQQRRETEQAEGTVQRQLITTAANDYRNKYQTVLENVRNTQQQTDAIFEMVNDPNFDPNKPINKARLADLMQMGSLMFRDSPDAMDALTQGAGALQGLGRGGAVAGGIAAGVATYIKSEDFKVTPEDYNRLALNLKRMTEKYAQQAIGQLAQQAGALDGFAKKRGVLPAEFSMQDYVTGGVKELPINPAPEQMRRIHVTKEERARLLEVLPPEPEDELMKLQRALQQGTPTRGLIKRPTN